MINSLIKKKERKLNIGRRRWTPSSSTYLFDGTQVIEDKRNTRPYELLKNNWNVELLQYT